MKIQFLLFFVALFFTNTQVITLDDLRWEKRVVLFFPASDDYIMSVGDSLRAEIDSRDIVYFVLTDSLQSNGDYSLDSTYIEALKAKYLLGSRTACWTLLGKDGGMKLRHEEELDWRLVLQTVDDRSHHGELVSW